MNESTDDGRIDRRKFLKSTGTVAGIGTLNVSPIRASPGTRLSTVEFVEVGMETEVSSVSDEDASLPVFHWDFPLPHAVDTQDDKLFVREPMSEAAVEALSSRPAVVKTAEFQPAPTTLFGKPTKTLTYEHGPHYRQNYVLELEDEYPLPSVSVAPNEETAVMSGAIDDEITAGTERQYELPSHEVEVEVTKTLDEKVDAPSIPESRRARKKDSWTETVTVTPTLKVANFGELEVVDATDGMVVRR